MSQQLSCRDMCKIVNWLDHYFLSDRNVIFFFKDLDYELINPSWNVSIGCWESTGMPWEVLGGSHDYIRSLYKIAEEGWGDTIWSESINKDTGTGMHLLVMLYHPFYFLMFFEVKQHTNHVISTFLDFISCLGNNCAKHVYDQGCLGKKYNQNAFGKQVQLEYFRQTSTTRTTRTPGFWDTPYPLHDYPY